ncbi:hypothetical protein BCU68_12930 [Vibrio sp. 10N.286.49.B3]|uniref:hypothetical protein n=1 Tax=Vibrio sp. 10N.286.49.B3 TaxID=1880855 RepID=UPI000C84204C|nr:hypothetical protein [Vibrio sp. 10N.286.49.B3]PMH43750.1 hypothetical protein BCU68_12930 [Vibrio sp. 10N.286.49.B3]
MSQNMRLYPLVISLAMVSGVAISADQDEKNPEDPTKIITKVGVGYSNEKATISGSLGLDDARMVNATINQDASEWSLGGSWLFDAGILNFNFRKTTYDDDSHNTSYNLGSFIPLSYFDFTPGGWQPFITGGYSYNKGEIKNYDYVSPVATIEPLEFTAQTNEFNEMSNHAVYLGAFAFKPWNEHWTTMAFLGTTQGSKDMSVYWAGIGASYRINKHNSFNIFGVASDSSIYGGEEKLSVNYRYEFN